MTSIREPIRKNVPFPTDVYEFTVDKWKMRPTKSRIHSLLRSGHEVKLDLGGADA